MTSVVSYLYVGQRAQVEFPNGWRDGFVVTALVPDCHKDMQGRTFKHRYNVRLDDGGELRELHPLHVRAA